MAGIQAPSAAPTTPQVQPASQLGGNSLLVGGLLAAVVGAFVGERLLRRLSPKRRRAGATDD
jgi:uncharacterized membrane protein YfcA